jgi:hypothetical protein
MRKKVAAWIEGDPHGTGKQLIPYPEKGKMCPVTIRIPSHREGRTVCPIRFV